MGTTDSHIKVFDSIKGFQTHNFLGHRGVITQLAFYPKSDALKIISASEDFTVRVWDLVLNEEVACLKGTTGRVAAFAFSPDMKTVIVGTKDARIAFFNAADNFKQIGAINVREIKGMEDETEVNALVYLEINDLPYLVVGGEVGKLAVLDLKRNQACWIESEFIPAEITQLSLTKNKQIIAANVD